MEKYLHFVASHPLYRSHFFMKAWSLNPEMFFSDDYNQVSSLNKLIQSGQNWKNYNLPLKQMKFLFDSHIAFLSLSIDSPSIVFRVCLNWKSNDTKRNTIATKALVFTPFSKFPCYFCALLSAIHQQMAFSQFHVTLKMKFYCQSLDNLKKRQAFFKIYPNKRLAL